MNKSSTIRGAKQIVANGYDQVALAYAQLEDTKWPRMRWLAKLLEQLAPNSSVLDLGCGSGDPADIEIAKEHQVTGVDISPAQIELAREMVPTGRFIKADLGSVSFPDGLFDAVVSFYTIEHLPREEHAALFQRVHQWMRADGLLLICTEANEMEDAVGDWLGVPMFFSSFDPETVKSMIQETGFEIVETAIEVQMEGDVEIPYLWVVARKQRT